MEQYHIGKGTTMLGPKPSHDFQKEQELIEKEYRRLNLPIPPRREDVNCLHLTVDNEINADD